MNKKELATLLNGRTRGNEINTVEIEQAKAAGLVVVYSASDDLLELEGAISEELGAYEGGSAILFKGPRRYEAVEDDSEYIRGIDDDDRLYCALHARMLDNRVRAIWSPKQVNATWLIQTSLPSYPFDIMEGEEIFCRGLVLSVNDLRA